MKHRGKQSENLLPARFLERLGGQYSQSTVQQIIKGFSAEKFPVLRVNTLKFSVRELMAYFREINVRFERVQFLPDALIIKNQKEKFFEELPIYKDGKIYFQSISSQLPAVFLSPLAGENILDLCAAPGSKTTQMAAMMGNKGKIFANEIDEVRCEKLKFNLDRQGVSIAAVNNGNGCGIGDLYPERFDKVLVDVPCTAEGRINLNDRRSFGFWDEKNIRQHAKLQKKLLESGFKALRPGGVLVYSTCTLAPEENEMVASFALQNFSGIEIERIGFEFKYSLPSLGVSGVFKAMPSEISEGFFIAKFRKI